MVKKKKLSLDELLVQVLVKDEDKPYGIPKNWVWTKLVGGFANCLDNYRKPINATERANREGQIPYYGATGQVGWIDDYLTNENLVLVGEDGAPFFDYIKDKAYIIDEKAWVNNHAHILKSYYGVTGNKFLMHYLNCFDYHGYVNGTTRLKLTQGSMANIPTPLPPLPEQKRIVDFIESFFEKLERAKEIVQNALDSFEERKSAILHEAYKGNLTVKWREEDGEDFVCEELEIRQLVTHLNQGWSPKCESHPSTDCKKWGVIKTTSIQHMEFNEEENKQLPDNLVPREKHELKKGDILITRAGPRIRVGVCCLITNVRPRLLLCDKAYRFRANIERVIPEYLELALNTPEILAEINLMKTGISESGVNLTQEGFMAIKLNIPPIKEQKEIIRIVDGLLKNEIKASELCDIIENIDLMKKSILIRAFRGELSTTNFDEESALELLKEVLKERV